MFFAPNALDILQLGIHAHRAQADRPMSVEACDSEVVMCAVVIRQRPRCVSKSLLRQSQPALGVLVEF